MVAFLFLAAASLFAQPLAEQARKYRESPTPARRDALLRFAGRHPKDSEGALALLALGVTAVGRGDHQDAIPHLQAAGKRLPQIADYTSYYLGLAYSAAGQHQAAAATLELVGSASPLAGRAALAAAKAHLAAGAPEQAIAAIQARYSAAAQPAADLVLAQASEESGAPVSAAYYAQRVYYGYPASNEAEASAGILARMREKLGADYPPPTPGAMLDRAAKWLQFRNYQRAQREYEALARELGGADRDLALVRAGAVRYRAGPVRRAFEYLKGLAIAFPDADAERLYYLVQCARSLDDREEMQALVEELGRRYPASPWRLEALFWAGNFYLLRNESAGYTPLFRACYEGFSESDRSEYCHWKIAWSAYMDRRSEAAGLLREHLTRFPKSDKSAAALYFLGRLAESEGAAAEARTSYNEILQRFPNSFYVEFAEQRLGGSQRPAAHPMDFLPDAATRGQIARSRLLASAGLYDLAETELRYVAGKGGSAHVLALELARQASQRSAPDEGLRHIKGAFPTYLATPLDSAPNEFWRLAFPLPYRQILQKQADTNRLDLYIVAGLIRQESEFSLKAVSPAGARGLMQMMPSTGRELAKRLQLRGFRAASLFTADVNVRLGTYHFRSLIDSFQGSVEAALAAYNGGKSRAEEWLSWNSYREPAEFIESIPFTETRTYVQAVLRNAWFYRRLYSSP